MAQPATREQLDGPVRKPGDFRRRGPDGPPIVASITNTRKPKGNKPELLAKAAERGIELPAKITVAELVELLGPEPRDDTYARPSGFAIDNPFNLIRWKERQLVRGLEGLMAEGPSMYVDIDDDSAVDGFVARAYEAAQTMLAAARGTHIHSLCDRADRNQPIDDLLDAGEALGIPTPLQCRIVEQWKAFRWAMGLEAVHIELPLVHDGWRTAGTCDRIDRVTGPSIVTPFGTVGEVTHSDEGQVTP